jgi:hypothetical protein
VLEQLATWQGRAPRELPAAMPEMAVAQGAAYYGLVRRGLATRIKGGTPRAFYIGVESGTRERIAVCLAPSGLDDGARVRLERDFRLVTNRPVSFRLYSSSSRNDQPGALVPIGDGRADTVDDGSDLLELPPIVTVLRARGRGEVTVRLEVHITALGALEIFCVDAEQGETWKLAFDMRSGGAAVQPQIRLAVLLPGSGERGLQVRQGNRMAQRDAHVQARLELSFSKRVATTGRCSRRARCSTRSSTSPPRARSPRITSSAGSTSPASLRGPEPERRWIPGGSRVMWGVFNEGPGHPKSEPGKLAWWIGGAGSPAASRRASRIRSTTGSRSCSCRARSRRRSSPRRSRASRSSPRSGASSRASSACRPASSTSSATS